MIRVFCYDHFSRKIPCGSHGPLAILIPDLPMRLTEPTVPTAAESQNYLDMSFAHKNVGGRRVKHQGPEGNFLCFPNCNIRNKTSCSRVQTALQQGKSVNSHVHPHHQPGVIDPERERKKERKKGEGGLPGLSSLHLPRIASSFFLSFPFRSKIAWPCDDQAQGYRKAFVA